MRTKTLNSVYFDHHYTVTLTKKSLNFEICEIYGHHRKVILRTKCKI